MGHPTGMAFLHQHHASIPMLSVHEALDLLLARAHPVTETDTVGTLAAAGRVLAATQYATIDVPRADNAAMDGYAVRSADCHAGAALPVSQRIAAGQSPAPLAPGSAARIFTGAGIPAGADAVVMQEHCHCADDGRTVTIVRPPAAGRHIRRIGEDIRAGAPLLEAGTRLRAPELAHAASNGLACLPVARRPRVAMLFTGDELVMPGVPLGPGQIYNANRYALGAMLCALGCETSDFGIVPDRLDATRAVLRDAAAGHDLVLSCGGASVGEADHVKPAVAAEGSLDMWKIAIKPGKPLAFGALRRHDGGVAHFIGLPGNPVASFVAFLLFVRPFLLRLQGARNVLPRPLSMRADFSVERPDERLEFLRVRVNDAGGLVLSGSQGAAVMSSAVQGSGLALRPPGRAIAAGDTVDYLPFAELLA
ncbi:MAG: gephyrin-like molybdotransferase Glp [Pseudomonadota bacterium]